MDSSSLLQRSDAMAQSASPALQRKFPHEAWEQYNRATESTAALLLVRHATHNSDISPTAKAELAEIEQHAIDSMAQMQKISNS